MGKVFSNDRVMQAIPDEVWTLARAHVAEQLENEVGGFLIGFLAGDGLTVTHALPAREAVGSAAQLTFPPESWSAVYAVIEERNQGERLVGWYHSHPGHGVFLSAYDQFIQTSFFPEEGQIAMVIDPQSGEEGVFVTRNSKIQDVVKRPGTKAKGETKAQKAAKRDRRSLFFRAGTVVILVGAFASFGMIRSGYHSGYSDGDTAGFDRGFNEGDTAGFERGDASGYTRGYKAGRSIGYSNGVRVGTLTAVQTYNPFVPVEIAETKSVQLLVEYPSEAEATAALNSLAVDPGSSASVISLEARWYVKVITSTSRFLATPSAVQDLTQCVANPVSCNP